jgi:hypothetical protein
MMLEEPRVCGATESFGSRCAASNAGSVDKQVLPMGTIAAHEAEVEFPAFVDG